MRHNGTVGAANSRSGWVVAVAALPAAAMIGACSLGFDTFDPVATSAGDASHADGPLGGGDSQVDTGVADSGSGDSSGGDTGQGGEGGCSGVQACVNTATSCGMSCGMSYQQCVGMCGGNTCRQMCRNTQNNCRSMCAMTCDSCATFVGCSASSQCQTASMM